MAKATHRFDPTAIREYDIRGVVGKTLSSGDAYAIGRGFATMLREAEGGKTGARKAAVGYDGRLSSPAMEAALVEGLRDGGISVLRVGLGPTPMLYFAVRALGLDGGVMVTGSHNPADYNGFKMMLGKGAFYGAQIRRIAEIAAAGAYSKGPRGSAEDRPVLDDYVERLLKDYRGRRPLTVAWDAGNGAAGEAMVRLTAKLPGRHLLLHQTIDGRFPNHHPDPTEPKNLVDLQAKVAEVKADLGIAFDGDGDRIGVVDGKGRILWGDQLMVLFAREVLTDKPGATVIADVKASQVLFDEIARAGGRPLMWRTGHSLIKAKMAETDAPLAGEMSGHIFFADRYYGYDDALYAAVRILGIASRSSSSMAEMRDALPQVINTPELRFQCSDERKFAVVKEVAARLAKAGANVSDIDGVRVSTRDGWWLLRASNTQDVLVARCESKTQDGLERLKNALGSELAASGVALPKF